QGYLCFTGQDATVQITVLHRAAQAFAGRLVWQAEVCLGKQSFACRTRPPGGAHGVVQMASGPADSLLNDSLFDIETDTALRLAGQTVKIVTVKEEPPQAFQATLTAAPQQPAGCAIELEVVKGYYQERYVPGYRPLDRNRCPAPPTGWMSWNVYFDTAGEQENLDEARVGAKFLKPYGLSIWSIESWQDNSDVLPVSNFHNLTLRPSPRKFPHGMKWLAEQIRALGFRPGIWTVPFGTGDEEFYLGHKDWFLHDKEAKPLRNWCGRYVLDPSQPAVRQHIEATHRLMAAEWGYEFFKIDGMSGRNPGYSAHFFERPEVRAAFKEPGANPYPLCIEALRRGIGPDRIFLACQGHYTGPEIASADAGRIGADIVHPNQPPHWENFVGQARATLNQFFVHNIVWYNDPDTLLVGAHSPLNVAQVAATIVALPGQVTFCGDKLGQLPPERMRLLQQALPVCAVRPLDLFPVFDLAPVWDLKVRRPFGSWDVVSVFNWSDQPAECRLAFSDLGLDDQTEYLIYEFWGRRFLGRCRGAAAAKIEARSNLLLAIHACLGRPQFLSTDRHITQGGVCLARHEWDAGKRLLSLGVQLVENEPLTVVVHVPAGFTPEPATAEGAAVEATGFSAERTLSITVRRPESGQALLRLPFGKE
ncbi:MAG: alpha-galactosidase, partial [Planctomycetota bacterium]